MRIHVVDDDQITRKMIATLLTEAGHEVAQFDDGAAAWEAYEAAPVPLVVTDWMMPRMTGVELCAMIRAHGGPAYTNVLIVTSLSLSEHTADAFEAGADDMLGKPVDPAALLRRVAVTERGHLAQAEHALRQSLELCQDSLGPNHASLLDALAALTQISRRQQSYVRCRAFVRRQLAIAQANFGEDDPRTKKLRSELEDLAKFEDRL